MPPKKTSSPWESSITRWNWWKTSDAGWWIVVSTLQPSFFARAASLDMTLYAANESRPEVGSSKKMSFGCMTSSTPMAVRFFSPPEMPRISSSPTSVSAHSSSPSSESILSTRMRFSASGVARGSRSIAEKSSASRGVCVGQSKSCCKTYAMRLRSRAPPTRWPSSLISPPTRCLAPLLRMRLARMLRSEVFPAPEGPKIAHTSPPPSAPEMPGGLSTSFDFLPAPTP
mmetsp:Transcript_10492/g.24298  ORF Transcript_10492/g.24298 Transcript_10492/m.24298 type:complete len:228 (-) Transcript_10492:97-780(-)